MPVCSGCDQLDPELNRVIRGVTLSIASIVHLHAQNGEEEQNERVLLGYSHHRYCRALVSCPICPKWQHFRTT